MGHAMGSGERIVAVVTEVIKEAHATGRKTIDLAEARDLCLAEARKKFPDLAAFLASPRGLVAVAITLSKLPHIVEATDDHVIEWTFARRLQ